MMYTYVLRTLDRLSQQQMFVKDFEWKNIYNYVDVQSPQITEARLGPINFFFEIRYNEFRNSL